MYDNRAIICVCRAGGGGADSGGLSMHRKQAMRNTPVTGVKYAVNTAVKTVVKIAVETSLTTSVNKKTWRAVCFTVFYV